MPSSEKQGITSKQYCLYGLFFFAVSLLITGYRWYCMNHAIQIPLIELLNDPTLYPTDIFADTRPSWVSYLWTLVAWLYRFIPLEPLLLGLFLIERAWIIFAAAYLAHTFAPRSHLAVIGAMAVIAYAPAPFIGGASVVQNYFEQTAFAIPFLLMAFAEFYRRRPIPTAIWLAVGFTLNCLYTFFTITYFLAVLILEWRELKKWIVPGIILLVLSVPTVLLTLSTYGKEADDPQLWMDITLIRSAIHFDPLSWPIVQYLKHILLIAASVWALFLSRDEKLLKHGLAWTVVSIAWVAFAFATAYLINIPAFQEIHPARGAGIWMLLAFIFIVVAVAKKFGNNRLIPIILVVIFILYGGAIAARRYMVTGHSILKPPRAEVCVVAEWAEISTTVDSMFLISPNWHEFRTVSRRGAFVTYKDGAVIMWDRSRTREWYDRFVALGFDILEPHDDLIEDYLDAYNELSDRDVENIAAEYGIDFWVVDIDKQSSFPVAYKNENHKVLDLNSGKNQQEAH